MYALSVSIGGNMFVQMRNAGLEDAVGDFNFPAKSRPFIEDDGHVLFFCCGVSPFFQNKSVSFSCWEISGDQKSGRSNYIMLVPWPRKETIVHLRLKSFSFG